LSISFAFRPRLSEAIRGYDRDRFVRDLGAGVTVGIVALPLAMAFAIASGLTPEAGLWTAIIAGLVIALFGGSNVQIGGPAGAFIVIVYGILQRYGLANLMIATSGAGILLFALGFLRLGRLVRYVPVSIVIGFTNGIAVLIACSQLKDWMGLKIPKMPADFFTQIEVMAQHISTFNVYSFALGLVCVIGLFAWPRLWGERSPIQFAMELPGMRRAAKFSARTPGPIVALVTLTWLATYFHLPVETIGSRFGEIPTGLPAIVFPTFSWETVKLLVAPTTTIAMLGAIESLLCARVSDQLTTLPRHDPNQELMAQGIANFLAPFFGGMPATGTIARTVTNVRAGATTPIAGVVHAITLAIIVLVAGRLAALVPLSVLSGILLFVAWNMGEWREFAHLRKYSSHYRLLMLGTFFLTVVFDLTVAVQVGLVTAVALFVRKMSSLFSVERVRTEGALLEFKLYGSLFFGAVSKIDEVVQAVETGPQEPVVVLDALHLVHLDTSGLDSLRQLHKAVLLRRGTLHLEDLQDQPREVIERAGFALELARNEPSAEVAV
jgi:SulP family sulfate permease